jgi:hypothetical protein
MKDERLWCAVVGLFGRVGLVGPRLALGMGGATAVSVRCHGTGQWRGASSVLTLLAIVYICMLWMVSEREQRGGRAQHSIAAAASSLLLLLLSHTIASSHHCASQGIASHRFLAHISWLQPSVPARRNRPRPDLHVTPGRTTLQRRTLHSHSTYPHRRLMQQR